MAARFKQIKLERLLSKRGICSRAKTKEFLRSNRVLGNGKHYLDPLALVSEAAVITVNGNVIAPEENEIVVVVFNKPKGFVTTTSDEKGRAIVFDLLPDNYKKLLAVGRLDMNTTGLLLFTNDSKLANFLTDPANAIRRTYTATVSGKVEDAAISKLLIGIEDEGELLRAADASILKTGNRESKIQLTLTEGKNREIRRLCKALGHEVLKLKRNSFGPWELGELEPGKCRSDSGELAVILTKLNE